LPNRPEIVAIDRVIVATTDLAAAKGRWQRAGFAFATDELVAGGLRCARMGAGAVAIDLCTADDPASLGALAAPMRTALDAGGGIIGWTWGVAGVIDAAASSQLPGPGLAPVRAAPADSLPSVFTAMVAIEGDVDQLRAALSRSCGDNPNTVDYLEHIVVMTPVLEDAIVVHERLGVPCKRIREAGNGMRQAFFKLEQTVLEVVGPARGQLGCWGLAFMCRDIAAAVAFARNSGLQATEPKAAIQGGLIARIVDPLDGVAVAFMQATPVAPESREKRGL
jgi:predicted enzyme related to lactoylglutathione lyase